MSRRDTIDEIETKSSISKSMASSRIDPSRRLRDGDGLCVRGWRTQVCARTDTRHGSSNNHRSRTIARLDRARVCARVCVYSRRNQSDRAVQRSHSVIGTVLCAITNGEINHDPDQTILTVRACRQNPASLSAYRATALQLTWPTARMRNIFVFM